MKQLTIVLLSLLCLFTVACGGPSAKEEAERLHKDHMLATKAMWNNECTPRFHKILKELPEAQQDIETAKLAEEFKPKSEELLKKAQGEKVQKQNQRLLELIQQQDKNLIDFLNLTARLKDKQNLNQLNWKQDFTNITIKTINTRLEYDNEYSKITTGKGTYELTLANFQKIHEGDTYQQVAETFKMPGTLVRSNNAQISGEYYYEQDFEWKIDDTRVFVSFDRGKAHLTIQHNLK